MQLLLTLGLRDRCRTICDDWGVSETKRKVAADGRAENDYKGEVSRLEAEFKPLKDAVTDLIVSRVIDIYPCVGHSAPVNLENLHIMQGCSSQIYALRPIMEMIQRFAKVLLCFGSHTHI